MQAATPTRIRLPPRNSNTVHEESAPLVADINTCGERLVQSVSLIGRGLQGDGWIRIQQRVLVREVVHEEGRVPATSTLPLTSNPQAEVGNIVGRQMRQ